MVLLYSDRLNMCFWILDNAAGGNANAGGDNANENGNNGDDNNIADSNNEDDGDDIVMSDSDDDDDNDEDAAIISLSDSADTDELEDMLFAWNWLLAGVFSIVLQCIGDFLNFHTSQYSCLWKLIADNFWIMLQNCFKYNCKNLSATSVNFRHSRYLSLFFLPSSLLLCHCTEETVI